MLKWILAISVCQVRNGKQSLGIWCLIAEVSLELEVQVWDLQDATFASINANKDSVTGLKHMQEWDKI